MATRKIQKQKKKGPGRPPTPGGLDPIISARVPQGVVNEVDAWAKKNDHRTRQEAIRALIERGLKV